MAVVLCRQIEEDLGEALRAQTQGSINAGLGHGAYSLKAGAGLAAAAAGAGDGEELDHDSEKLLQVRRGIDCPCLDVRHVPCTVCRTLRVVCCDMRVVRYLLGW